MGPIYLFVSLSLLSVIWAESILDDAAQHERHCALVRADVQKCQDAATEAELGHRPYSCSLFSALLACHVPLFEGRCFYKPDLSAPEQKALVVLEMKAQYREFYHCIRQAEDLDCVAVQLEVSQEDPLNGTIYEFAAGPAATCYNTHRQMPEPSRYMRLLDYGFLTSTLVQTIFGGAPLMICLIQWICNWDRDWAVTEGRACIARQTCEGF